MHIQQAKSGQQTKLHVAMREYGVDAFEWMPIVCALSGGNLDALEKILIKQYGSDVTGYNVIGPSYDPPHYFKRKVA
ncbi:hypothetical protein A6456_10610 [Paraburkholderia tropica]|nr:hypothetical protein A6456_10610 [Paraburkholderia tropica]